MLKLGILDFDTSHCVEFTKRLNHVGNDKEQFIDGAKVVAMFATGKSPLDAAETVEIVAFIEAANRSAANHGGGGETVKV